MSEPTTTKPAFYIHGHHQSVLRSHTWRTADNSAAYLLPFLKPDMRILDVGCGPGTITVDLAARVPHGHVTGLDAAASVLDSARAHAEAHDTRNIEFIAGDAYALPFPDETFDVVHAHQVLQHVADPVGLLREMRRVTKAGGIVAARDADYAGMTWFPESAGMTEWLDLYEKIARISGGEPDAGRRIHMWARKAGFEAAQTACSAGTWCYYTPEEREWWGGLWADRVLQSTFAKTAEEHGLATEEDLKRISQAWREWAKSEDAWFSVLHGEVLARV